MVSPSENWLPEPGVQLTSTLRSTRSVAVAVKFTVAPLGPVASAVLSSGRLSDGAVVSSTVTFSTWH